MIGSGVTLSLPQSIATTSTPTFGGLTLTGLSGMLQATAGVISGRATTTNLPEGTNLYFTDARARSAISSTTTGLTFTPATGVLSLTSGYVIPTTGSAANWDSAYNNRITSASLPLSITSNALKYFRS